MDQLNEFCSAWEWRPIEADEELIKQDLIQQLNNVMANVVNYDYLIGLPKEADDDEWFETLVSNINKRLLKLQAQSMGMEARLRRDIQAELMQLKRNFADNDDRIRTLESCLQNLVEKEVADKLCNYMKDDICNNEKMTPRFLTIAKTMIRDNLSVIRDDQGRTFDNKKDRQNYIRQFYVDLYNKPANAPQVWHGCIERFLGPDIVNSNTVISSRLTDIEKDDLETPITLGELDAALKKSNKKSAPGIDGSSNKLIEKIWSLVRVPLYRYAQCCFRKGRLTASFSTACIKLIPKKGDTQLLKNWRPISLLSCYYKLLSRVINVRLGKVIDKITGRSLKAYTCNKYLQEVIINITNKISYCNETGTPGMLRSKKGL